MKKTKSDENRMLYSQNCENYNLEICSQNVVLHFQKCCFSQEYTSHRVSIDAVFCFGQQPLILEKYNCLFFGPCQTPYLNLNIHGETLYSITTQSKLTSVLKNRVNNELTWTRSRIVLIMNFSLFLRWSAEAKAPNLIIHKWPSQFC